jgi:hypothetical protein
MRCVNSGMDSALRKQRCDHCNTPLTICHVHIIYIVSSFLSGSHYRPCSRYAKYFMKKVSNRAECCDACNKVHCRLFFVYDDMCFLKVLRTQASPETSIKDCKTCKVYFRSKGKLLHFIKIRVGYRKKNLSNVDTSYLIQLYMQYISSKLVPRFVMCCMHGRHDMAWVFKSMSREDTSQLNGKEAM